jgi:aspartyl protease family protein
MRRIAAAAAFTAALLAAGAAGAQTVSMSGSLGSYALLVIDGKPRNVAVGATVQGVRLVSVSGSDALVEVQGKRFTLRLGDAQVNLGGKVSEGIGKQIVLTAQSGGHFFTSGTINGKAVRFVVDTGATMVSMGEDEADRLGLAYKSGVRGVTRTANGIAPAYKVSLASVRIGDVQVYNVDAIVVPTSMGYILLGNSYLTRFQMKRENDVLTLDLRY